MADRLHEIAELAAKHEPPGCEPGVAWGRQHVLADVPLGMRGDWAWWVIDNLLGALSAEERRAFMAAVENDPAIAAAMWRTKADITEDEAERLLAAARGGLPDFRTKHDAGRVSAARERQRG